MDTISVWLCRRDARLTQEAWAEDRGQGVVCGSWPRHRCGWGQRTEDSPVDKPRQADNVCPAHPTCPEDVHLVYRGLASLHRTTLYTGWYLSLKRPPCVISAPTAQMGRRSQGALSVG